MTEQLNNNLVKRYMIYHLPCKKRLCVCLSLYICVYMFMCIYIYIYIHTHICLYMHFLKCFKYLLIWFPEFQTSEIHCSSFLFSFLKYRSASFSNHECSYSLLHSSYPRILFPSSLISDFPNPMSYKILDYSCLYVLLKLILQ